MHLPLLLEELLADVRFALRVFRKDRVSLGIAIGTLTVGMAVATTAFAIYSAALLDPGPYSRLAVLRAISEDQGSGYGRFSTVSPSTALALRNGTRSFARFGLSRDAAALAASQRALQAITVTEIDTAIMSMLAVTPSVGRWPVFEDITSHASVALISAHLARALFADSIAVGRALYINSRSYGIIGVMPEQFNYPVSSDAWIPIQEGRADASYGSPSHFTVLAELKGGVNTATAQRELDLVSRQLKHSDPRYYKDIALHLRTEAMYRVTVAWRPVLVLFLGAAACVMLVGCLNVGNLLTMRAEERRAEFAIRTVLGASFARLVRQVAVESSIISVAAAGIGWTASLWLLKTVDRLVALDSIPQFRLAADAKAFAFLSIIAAAAIVVTSSSAVRQLQRPSLNALLKSAGPTSTSAAIGRSGERGVVIQVMLCAALTIVAAVFASGYDNILGVPRGYERHGLIEAAIGLDSTSFPDSTAREALYRDISAGLLRSPTIEREAREAQFVSFRDAGLTVATDGEIYPVEQGGTSFTTALRPRVRMRGVSDSYFLTLGVPMLAGRSFLQSDMTGTPLVVVVSQRLAASMGQRGSVVGRRVRIGRNGPVATVVGISGDIRVPTRRGMRLVVAGVPDAYFTERQIRGPHPKYWVRARGDVAAALAAVVKEIRTHARGLTSFLVRPAPEDENVRILRMIASVLGATSVVAFMMALLGIYAVTNYAVVQQTRSIGIQLALGASPSGLYLQIIRQGLSLVACGLFLGLGLAAVLEQFIRPSAWGATQLSLPIYAVTAVLFLLVGVAACHQAGRRAASVQPATALRA